jgi:hypothetical protein
VVSYVGFGVITVVTMTFWAVSLRYSEKAQHLRGSYHLPHHGQRLLNPEDGGDIKLGLFLNYTVTTQKTTLFTTFFVHLTMFTELF